ncbi:ninjurin-2 [Elysia marginata]|uniref:Ninjurin-2 n=1 Tax=Elysia marginata TaxID=1093978 RepID=A0AAV4G1B7_9GAST|nr:ninjurin-2 [Elysia marginata]
MRKVTPSDNGKSRSLRDVVNQAHGSNPTTPAMVHQVGTNRSSDPISHGSSSGNEGGRVNLTLEDLEPLLSTNQYQVRKMVAQRLMDYALMMANISQLRTLITAGEDLEHYIVLVCMVSFSLLAQLIFAIIIFIIWTRETEENSREEFLAHLRQVAASKAPESLEAKESLSLEMAKLKTRFQQQRLTNRMNYGTVVLVFMITVTNMFITGFGIKLEKPPSSEPVTSSVGSVTSNPLSPEAKEMLEHG